MDLLLKLLTGLFSPGFEEIIREIQKSQKRNTSREIEAAKEAAQTQHDARQLQKKLGELTE